MIIKYKNLGDTWVLLESKEVTFKKVKLEADVNAQISATFSGTKEVVTCINDKTKNACIVKYDRNKCLVVNTEAYLLSDRGTTIERL